MKKKKKEHEILPLYVFLTPLHTPTMSWVTTMSPPAALLEKPNPSTSSGSAFPFWWSVTGGGESAERSLCLRWRVQEHVVSKKLREVDPRVDTEMERIFRTGMGSVNGKDTSERERAGKRV